MALEWNKVIVLVIIVSIAFIVLGEVYKEGEFDVSGVENLKEKVPIIWKVLILGAGLTAAHTLLYKYKKKESWSKKDFFILFVAGLILYFIWTNIISPAQIDILTQSTAQIMNAVGQINIP